MNDIPILSKLKIYLVPHSEAIPSDKPSDRSTYWY